MICKWYKYISVKPCTSTCCWRTNSCSIQAMTCIWMFLVWRKRFGWDTSTVLFDVTTQFWKDLCTSFLINPISAYSVEFKKSGQKKPHTHTSWNNVKILWTRKSLERKGVRVPPRLHFIKGVSWMFRRFIWLKNGPVIISDEIAVSLTLRSFCILSKFLLI